MINPQVGDISDFQLVKSGILGDQRKEVNIVAVMGFSAARLIDPQLQSKHVAMYPYFKDKVNNVNDASAYQYIAYVGVSGQTEVVGIPWIMDSTYKPIQGRTMTIVITNWREDYRAVTNSFLADLGAKFTMNESTH